MAYKIFIDGEAGTTGLEIKERLSKLKGIQILHIPPDLRKDSNERLKLFNEADLVFLCLPDSESLDIVKKANPNTRIIDTSTGHRVSEGWVYGLPELNNLELNNMDLNNPELRNSEFNNIAINKLKINKNNQSQRELIKKSNRVANPGCHATGFILLISPLINAGIVGSTHLLTCNSITGYSGGGKAMIGSYTDDKGQCDFPLKSPRQYALSQEHKHIPEMLKYTGLGNDPIFLPVVSDYYRGMLVSVPIHKQELNKSANIEDIMEVYKSAYKDEKCINIIPQEDISQGGFLAANTYAKRDDVAISVLGNNDRMNLVCVYDNLGKGASGAAIQNMNIMLDLPEHEGLKLGN